jgi:hypothetical protein
MTEAAPSGVVTFLFTDIEGSTRRWEADADAMRAALMAHDEVLRTAIDAREGFLFSHTGDGVVAAFASPKSAVDAAVAAQRELELPVRMGIATGEAELRDGDYFGTVLNRAARVMAAGHGEHVRRFYTDLSDDDLDVVADRLDAAIKSLAILWGEVQRIFRERLRRTRSDSMPRSKVCSYPPCRDQISSMRYTGGEGSRVAAAIKSTAHQLRTSPKS